jgi:hypothetical protein
MVHLSTCQAINLFRQASVRRKWSVNASRSFFCWVLDCVPALRTSSFCHFILNKVENGERSG